MIDNRTDYRGSGSSSHTHCTGYTDQTAEFYIFKCAQCDRARLSLNRADIIHRDVSERCGQRDSSNTTGDHISTIVLSDRTRS